MSDGSDILVIALIVILFSGVFWNIGHDTGMKREQTKVVKSQKYVDGLRAIESAKKQMVVLKEKLNHE